MHPAIDPDLPYSIPTSLGQVLYSSPKIPKFFRVVKDDNDADVVSLDPFPRLKQVTMFTLQSAVDLAKVSRGRFHQRLKTHVDDAVSSSSS